MSMEQLHTSTNTTYQTNYRTVVATHQIWGSLSVSSASESGDESAARRLPSHGEHPERAARSLRALALRRAMPHVIVHPEHSSADEDGPQSSGDSSCQAQLQGSNSKACSSTAETSCPPPATPVGQQWSLGSQRHNLRQCKPCAFHWKPGGCQNGVDCAFCHLCDEGEIRYRRRVKTAQLKVGKLVHHRPGH
eukprot:TRINITY_DN45333_c0_g1_i1.p1 TRINITY_DN45333_c0_g1~~TRINITY_DN45333_c0_g1_i1.p1  ORF type:complete len:192 (+),score=9.59 TRINITY_DN45333_c0_g1_i1:92-667(+)